MTPKDTESSIALLKELTQADAVPGHEDEVRQIFASRLRPVGNVETDRMGNIFCTRNTGTARPRVLLDSHMDEVGFLVQRVTSDGHVKFVPVGGWWSQTLLAQRVTITTKKGKVPGVIGSTPPHLLSDEAKKKVVDIKDLFVDIGAENAKQATEEFGVRPGCPITPYGPFVPLRHPKLFTAKAFDNRNGVAIVIEAMTKLAEHPNTVIGAGCVQEEVGLRGAKTIAASVDPDVAIVLEAPPADDAPGVNPADIQGKLGAGVQIRLFDPTMIANPRLADLAIETAREHKINHQIAVRHSGGTNAGSIHTSRRGVPTIVLGVPTRYIHSHVSIINIDDYLATLELVLRLVPKLDEKTVASLV